MWPSKKAYKKSAKKVWAATAGERFGLVVDCGGAALARVAVEASARRAATVAASRDMIGRTGVCGSRQKVRSRWRRLSEVVQRWRRDTAAIADYLTFGRSLAHL